MEPMRTESELNSADFEDVPLHSSRSSFATPLLHTTVSAASVVKIHIGAEDSESERRACRICQSETGALVRPCGCSGTMADIHETCLNEWLQRARNRDACEICQREYARSENCLPPVWQWGRPNLEFKNFAELCMVAGLGFSLGYMVFVTEERSYSRRSFALQYVARPTDIMRILLICLVFATFVVGVVNSAAKIHKYVTKQWRVRFVDASRDEQH